MKQVSIQIGNAPGEAGAEEIKLGKDYPSPHRFDAWIPSRSLTTSFQRSRGRDHHTSRYPSSGPFGSTLFFGPSLVILEKPDCRISRSLCFLPLSSSFLFAIRLPIPTLVQTRLPLQKLPSLTRIRLYLPFSSAQAQPCLAYRPQRWLNRLQRREARMRPMVLPLPRRRPIPLHPRQYHDQSFASLLTGRLVIRSKSSSPSLSL